MITVSQTERDERIAAARQKVEIFKNNFSAN
jgi:hypothetical protein